MKPALIATILAGAIGAGAVVLLSGDGEVQTTGALQPGDYRLAIADEACRTEGEPGWDYQQEKCVWTLSRAGYCACITSDDEPLARELTEAELEALKTSKPEWFVDIGVCQEGARRWVQYAPMYCDQDPDCPGTATCNASHKCRPGPTWTCKAIALEVPKVLVSMSAAKPPLHLAMAQACCADCEHGCFVRPTSWGHCPYCLLDDNCDSYCPAPPAGP